MCCSESRPAWLLVSLGAVRPLAALALMYDQDLSYTLWLGNASDGPFVQVARSTCEICVMNQYVASTVGTYEGADWRTRRVHQLVPAASAAFVRLVVTWSAAGGVGGCNDLCDWASKIYELDTFGPGFLPPAWTNGDVPPPPAPSLSAPPAQSCFDADLVLQSDMESSVVLTGNAVITAAGSGMRGASSVALTPPEPHRFGTAEYARIIRPTVDCSCAAVNFLIVTAYVWLGASASMPGEGLVISLVDARRQTPGKTVFKRGCGTRPLLPEASVSFVLDTGDSDPSCDEPGTGLRMVASIEGGSAPPLVLCSSLDMSTASYRKGEWLPVQIQMQRTSTWIYDSADSFAVLNVYVNGTETLNPFFLQNIYYPRIRAANISLESFYIVVSARTGGISSDRHAVSGVHVEHCPPDHEAAIENWAGLRQPFTPPPASPPWLLPLQPPQRPAAVRGAAQLGAESFGAAFACTLGLLLAVALWYRRAPPNKHAATDAAGTPESDEAWLLSAPPPAAKIAVVVSEESPGQSLEFDVFLSYRRADALLVDTVHDKLRLAGLRVFKDVDGFLAGQPFDAQLVRIMRGVPVFAPVVTLASLQRLGGAATQCDAFLAELLVALSLLEAGNLCLIRPLLVGREADGGWASLLEEAAYEAALAALPGVASAATVALVDSALRSAGAAPMPPHIAALTVREVLLGRAASPAVAGVLSSAPFALACSAADLDLHISRQYAAPMWDAIRKRMPLA